MGMVSAGALLPVLKSVADTVTVHPAPSPRSSVIWTLPRLPLIVPPVTADPRKAAAGAVIDSGPLMMRTVAVQPGRGAAGGQVLPGTEDVAVLVRTRLPVSW